MSQVHKAALEPRLSVFCLLLAVAWVVQKYVPGLYLGYGILACFGGVIAFYVIAVTLRGTVERILLGWVALFPLGYYFCSFPSDAPILTFDRAVIMVLLLGMLFAPRDAATRVPRALGRAATAWAVFVLAVLVSFVHLGSFFGPFGIVVDAFVLPALLGLYVIRHFDVRQHLGSLHLLVCVVASYLAAIGLAEMIRGEDLLPLPGAGLYYAGLGDSLLLRPNGPFLATHSFALVGLLDFCFLIFLRRALSEQLPRWQRRLHIIGVVSSVGVALMTLTRAVALALLFVLILDSFSAHSYRRRMVNLGLATVLVSFVLIIFAVSPAIFEERVSSPANVYARIAQQFQTLRVFWSSPITGVGFSNFSGGLQKLSGSTPEFLDVEAVGGAHNNLGAMLADTGLLGFLPYVLSQILLLKAFWKARTKRTAPAALASRSLLYLFLVYWINGLNISSLYSSDLNLWFLFTSTCVYKFGIADEAACFG
jgi:hypothetical protein